MFNHEMAIEKRLERLLGTSYRVDIMEEAFIEKMQKKILAECKDKLRENIYRRVEEQTTRDRMLEACGYKIDDLEDLSKRFGKRKKKIKRMLKTMPLLLQKTDKEPEDKTLAQQRMVLEEKAKSKEPEEKRPSMMKYKVALVNEMDDDKSIDELYRMADSIVWKRDLSKLEEVETVEEEEEKRDYTEIIQPLIKAQISEVPSIDSDAASEVSSEYERSEEEEEESKPLFSVDGTLVDSATTSTTSARRTKKKRRTRPSVPPIDTETTGAQEIESIKAMLADVAEEFTEGSPTEEPLVDLEEEQGNGREEELEIAAPEEVEIAAPEEVEIAAPEETEIAASEETEIAAPEVEIAAPEEMELAAPEEIAQQTSSEIVPEISPTTISTSEREQLEAPAEQEISEERVNEANIPEATIEIGVEQEGGPEKSTSKVSEIEMEEEVRPSSSIPSFDTLLAREAQKEEYQDGKPKIEEMVIAVVRERVSLVEEERMAQELIPSFHTEEDIQDTEEQAEVRHLQTSYPGQEADVQGADSANSENKSLEEDSEQIVEETQPETECLDSPHSLQQDHQTEVVSIEEAVDLQEEKVKDQFEEEQNAIQELEIVSGQPGNEEISEEETTQ